MAWDGLLGSHMTRELPYHDGQRLKKKVAHGIGQGMLCFRRFGLREGGHDTMMPACGWRHCLCLSRHPFHIPVTTPLRIPAGRETPTHTVAFAPLGEADEGRLTQQWREWV